MLSGPGAEVSKHFKREDEISSCVSLGQSPKGGRIEARGGP